MAEVPSICRNYADVLKDKSEEFFNIQTTSIQYEEGFNYRLIGMIGSGYSSVVYKAYHFPTKKPVICKIFIFNNEDSLLREVKMLRILNSGEHIAKLLGVVYFHQMSAPGLVLEKMDYPFVKMYKILNEELVKHYGLQILKAIDYCHKHGIIHQDIKPENMVVNIKSKTLKLIDWGSAILYRSNKSGTRLACTAGYISPELLLNQKYFNYAVDLWSVGCIFAEMVFRRSVFGFAEESSDQLNKIIEVLGSTDFRKYVLKYNVPLPIKPPLLFSCTAIPLSRFTDHTNKTLVNDDSLDLIQSLLKYDPEERLTAKEAVAHAYFQNKKENLSTTDKASLIP